MLIFVERTVNKFLAIERSIASEQTEEIELSRTLN